MPQLHRNYHEGEGRWTADAPATSGGQKSVTTTSLFKLATEGMGLAVVTAVALSLRIVRFTASLKKRRRRTLSVPEVPVAVPRVPRSFG